MTDRTEWCTPATTRSEAGAGNGIAQTSTANTAPTPGVAEMIAVITAGALSAVSVASGGMTDAFGDRLQWVNDYAPQA